MEVAGNEMKMRESHEKDYIKLKTALFKQLNKRALQHKNPEMTWWVKDQRL